MTTPPRRHALLGLAATLPLLSTPTAANATGPSLVDRLADPGQVGSASGLGLFGRRSEVNFPTWLAGDWDATSTFDAFRAPLGNRFDILGVGKSSPNPGDQLSFPLRFTSTSRASISNTTTSSRLVEPDRAYNAKSTFNARALKEVGFSPIQTVDYDPKEGRLVLIFSKVGPDMQPLPQRRLELFIRSRDGYLSEDGDVFYASEQYRQVYVATRTVDVTDYEVLWSFRLETDGQVAVRQRTLYFLEPRDELYFEANGKAVAVYDEHLTMTRAVRTEVEDGSVRSG